LPVPPVTRVRVEEVVEVMDGSERGIGETFHSCSATIHA
jgi:hypothetical protein